jgi:hypothetical protein
MEQAAVLIVALELDFKGSRKIERLSSLNKTGLEIVGLLGHGQGVGLAQLLAVLVLDMLLVLGHKSLLLDIAVIVNCTGRGHAVLVARHRRGRSFRSHLVCWRQRWVRGKPKFCSS